MQWGNWGSRISVKGNNGTWYASRVLGLFDIERVEQARKVKPPYSINLRCVLIEPHTENFMHKGMRISRQFTLRLAWACTVHKTQGMTVEGRVVSLARVFLPGMAYVALNRIKK